MVVLHTSYSHISKEANKHHKKKYLMNCPNWMMVSIAGARHWLSGLTNPVLGIRLSSSVTSGIPTRLMVGKVWISSCNATRELSRNCDRSDPDLFACKIRPNAGCSGIEPSPKNSIDFAMAEDWYSGCTLMITDICND